LRAFPVYTKLDKHPGSQTLLFLKKTEQEMIGILDRMSLQYTAKEGQKVPRQATFLENKGKKV
jgi:hypothetical protein